MTRISSWLESAIGITMVLLGVAPHCLAACDIQVKRTYIQNYLGANQPPRVGDPWVMVVAEYRVIGTPGAAIPIRLHCGGEAATCTHNVGAGENYYVSGAFSTNIDGPIPWTVEFDPNHLLGDTDYSNNTGSGSFAPLAPEHVIDRYMVRAVSAVESRYVAFAANSGTVGRIEYLFGEPVTSSSQGSIREYAPPAGASRIITSPSGIPVQRVQWLQFDTSAQTTATATHSFKADLWNVRVNRAILETVRWQDLSKPLPSDVAMWRQSEPICPTNHARINEFVAEYLPPDYRTSMSPYAAARRLFLGVANKLDYGPKVGPINALANAPHRGDCGDFSRIFVAALRNVGFAARVSSGWWEGDAPPDSVWHMWTEFYMPGYGWIPADPTKDNDVDSTGTFAYFFGNVPFLFQLCSVTFGGPCTWPELGTNIDDLQVPWWYWNGGATFVATDCPASLHLEPSAAVLLEKPWTLAGDHTFITIDVRDRAPAGGMSIGLSSSSPALSLPSSVSLTEGSWFTKVPVTTTPIAADESITIRATLPSGTISTSVFLKAAPPALLSASINSPVTGGAQTIGTVTLDAPAPAEGITVYLSTDRPDIAEVPAAVLVPAGARSVNFALDAKQVTSDTTIAVSLTCYQSLQTATLTVTPSLWTISGAVMDSQGAPVIGAVLDGLPGGPSTSQDGTYTAIVQYGWSGTVVPRKSGLRFSPEARVYTSITTSQTSQDYTATTAADLDRDGDVDLQDAAIFGECLLGPAFPVRPGCELADLDNDQDADQADFGLLQRCFSGSLVPARPTCSE